MIHATLLQIITLPILLIVIFIGIKKKYTIQKQILILLFIIYIVGVISITFFPLPIQKELIEHRIKSNFSFENNFTPLKTIVDTISNDSFHVTTRVIIGNIVLFIPFGGLLPLLYKKISKLKSIFLLGLTFSTIIELTQFLISSVLGFNYRMTNVDDILLNTFGAIIGFIMLKISIPITDNFFDMSHLKK